MTKQASLLAGALALGLASGALAAEPAPTPSAPSGQATAKAENIPDPEKVQRSTECLVAMRVKLKVVLGMLSEARASKDVVKLNCVNEKLTNLKALLRISEQSDILLQEAVARAEPQTAGGEYAKVTIARAKVEQLGAEAEQCVGMLAFETGPTEVTVEVPADLPQTDPTVTSPPPPVINRPPPASPTS